MKQQIIPEPTNIIVIRKLEIQECIVNNQHTIIVKNESKIDKPTCMELLQIAIYITQNFKL